MRRIAELYAMESEMRVLSAEDTQRLTLTPEMVAHNQLGMMAAQVGDGTQLGVLDSILQLGHDHDVWARAVRANRNR